ncbi:hypothetical protein ACOME3_008290 [Neoechinorhynchus agilis]
MYLQRLIIPKSLLQSVLRVAHEGHPGIEGMKALTHYYVWWPGLDKEVEQQVKTCVQCQVSRPNVPILPIFHWDVPYKPWERVHVDLAGPINEVMFMIAVDARTKWPEVWCLNRNSTSKNVISKLRECFARMGCPKYLVTDNGPQFVSEEFSLFCSHTTFTQFRHLSVD